MPTYSYQCQICTQEWPEEKSMDDIQNVTCPSCMAWGGDKQVIDGVEQFIVKQLCPMPHFINPGHSELGKQAWEDGAVEMPALGPNVVVRSQQEFDDAKKRAVDAHFQSTDGEHSAVRPFKKDNGEVVLDKVTRRTTGVDLGEIRDMREIQVGETALDKGVREAGEKVAGKRRTKVPRKLTETKRLYSGKK